MITRILAFFGRPRTEWRPITMDEAIDRISEDGFLQDLRIHPDGRMEIKVEKGAPLPEKGEHRADTGEAQGDPPAGS